MLRYEMRPETARICQEYEPAKIYCSLCGLYSAESDGT
jgi:hypothetical protein